MVNLPIGINIDSLINDLRNLSWEACDILNYYSQMLRDKNKRSNIIKNNNDDPVTLADLKVNEIIIQRINEKYKDTNWEILSEENAKKSSDNCDLNSDWIWVLDPLDGTKDFIQGSSNYAMHLALNYKKRPLLGIVLIPEKDELWIAVGGEAWGEKRNGLIIKPALSNNENLQKMNLVSSKNHRNGALNRLITEIDFNEVNVMGSIGCKIASIIRGENDIYVCLSMPGKSSPKDWDFAAPEAILKASGGAITNLDNINLSYGNKNFEQGGIIIASNSLKNHARFCLEIREIIINNEIYPLNEPS